MPREIPPGLPSRRAFLKATSLGLATAPWLTRPGVAMTRRELPVPEIAAKARAVIHIHLPGGIAHQESFDSKPYAPAEYRGPYKSIPTKVDGVFFGELFARTAAIADRLCICRAMTHGEAAHERGTHNMFTGYRPSPALVYPSIGSVVAHELGPRADLPPYVCIPRSPTVYAGAGYLSSAFNPFSIGSDPADKDFQVKDLSVQQGIDDARLARRRHLLGVVDEPFTAGRPDDALAAVGSFYARAWSLIESPTARAAFDLGAEPDALKNEYGKNAAGLRMLLARRLIEAGVRYTTLSYGAWDHHDNIKNAMSKPARELDQAYARLILDLEQRGLLDSTLVMVTSEFGRSPKINATDGRDHWPRVFTTLLAGGGVKRGLAYGLSDPRATEPEDDPLGIEDLATTVYHLLGIDAGKELIAPGNRPIEIVKGGRVVEALLA